MIPAPPTPRVGRLASARDGRRFAARLIRETYAGTFDATKAAKIGYLIGIYLKACELGEMEQRISALEQSGGTDA